MTTEEGIVISRDGSNARVRTQKTEACRSCAAKSACTTLGGGKEMEVDAANQAGAVEGDRVLIGFDTSSMMKASFLIYLFPIFSMILGGFIGQSLAPAFNGNETHFSVAGAATFVIAAFLLIRIIGKRLSHRESYIPKIIRILNTPGVSEKR
ncbi:MAG: SoxR reducing system RseC family protein [Thermodesulfobacteriota bacterium]